ncbi:MAG: restriction endonuclease subunit S [Burkholderiales bacterium]
MFGKLNPRVEKVWRIGNHTAHRKIGSTEWLPLVPRHDVDEQFLYFLMWSEHVMPKAKTLVSGSTPSRQRVDPRSFYRIEAPLPPLPEQRKIAGVLGVVQRAIEQQERLLQLTTELKKTLVHQLFTHGLRGEAQKETEIGPVPESWEVASLGAAIAEDPKNGLYKHSSTYGSGTPILRIDDFSNDGDIVTSASNRVMTDDSESKLYALREDDIVTNRVNSLSHLGKTALIGELPEPMVFESNMMRFRVDERRALPRYVFRVLNSPVCKKQIIGSAKRAVAQSSINQGNLKAILLPLPSFAVQEEISAILETVVNKVRLHEMKKQSLTDIFRTLLHQLMTAQIRVHDFDLAALGLARE